MIIVKNYNNPEIYQKGKKQFIILGLSNINISARENSIFFNSFQHLTNRGVL